MKPVKSLLHSTTIYEVVIRGDVFAFELETGKFTVLPKGRYPVKSVEFVVPEFHAESIP